MEPDVKPRRSYRSPRRRAQADATRVAIINAAHQLFIDRGYIATTLADIARSAAVAVPTIKLVHRTKPALLRAVWEHLISSGPDTRPLHEQDWFVAMLATRDPREHLRLKVLGSVAASGRIAPLVEVIRAASHADPEVAVLWDELQTQSRETQRKTVERLRELGGLRENLREEEAVDLLYTLNHGTYHTLVGRLGWRPERYREWLTATLIQQLLP